MAERTPRFPLDFRIDRTENGYRLISPQVSREGTDAQSIEELIATITELLEGTPRGDDSARREEIASRVPSRERVRALMERLPPPERWLDDEQDWVPPGKPGD